MTATAAGTRPGLLWRKPLLFDRQAKLALVLVCLALTLCSFGFRSAVRSLNVYLKKEPVHLRQHFDNIPKTLGQWQAVGETRKLSVEMIEELGTDLYLDRHYIFQDGRKETWLMLHVTYYTGMIDAVPHVPDRCLVAGGFNARTRAENLPMPIRRDGWSSPTSAADGGLGYPALTFLDSITNAPVTVHMPQGEFLLRTTEFSHKDRPDTRIFAGYFFVANGRIAVTPEEVKAIAFRKSEEYAYFCKVQFSTIGDKDLTAGQFVQRSADFIEVLLPELMRCLPDWPEVLSRSSAPSADSDG